MTSLNKKEEISLEEYKLIVKMNIYEGEVYWSRFNVFLAVNSALLAVIVLVLRGNSDINAGITSSLRTFISMVSVGGSVVSLVWLFSSLRAHEFYRYWIDRGKEIENTLKHAKLYKRMEKHFDGLPRREFYKRIPVLSAAYALPLCFFLIYLASPVLLFGPGPVELIALVLSILVLVFFVLWGDYEFEKYERMPAII